MDVIEHIFNGIGADGRAAFTIEWWQLTGSLPSAESIQGYWLRHGFIRQAG